MSWITRCPDCDTVYMVESEQLQQAHGWLRCGTCQHVFDSTGRVVAADVIPTLTARVNVGEPQLGRMDLERLLHKESPVPAKPLPDESAAPIAAVQASPDSSIAAFEDALHSFKMPDVPEPRVDDDVLRAHADHSSPSQAPHAKVPASVSVVTVVMAWVLGVVLVFQALLALRPAILSQWPQVGQVFSPLCSTSACRAQWQPALSLWSLRSQPMVFDGAVYRLGWSLSHSASTPLTVPDLELVVLDAQGKIVSAQRLTATITAAPATLAAGQNWQNTLWVKLPSDLGASRAQLRLIHR